MAVLVALPGLLTIPMRSRRRSSSSCWRSSARSSCTRSYVRQVAAPLKALGENLALETNALRRRYEEEAPESSLEAVIADALPCSTGSAERVAADEESFERPWPEWLDGRAARRERFAVPRYVQQLRGSSRERSSTTTRGTRRPATRSSAGSSRSSSTARSDGDASPRSSRSR
jgi:hypothetical protein